MLKIEGTDVSLDIPAGALLDDCEVTIKILPGNWDAMNNVSFTSNSAVIVELSPNNLEFQTEVALHLPHCLELKKGHGTKAAKILMSHHAKGRCNYIHALDVLL